MAKYNGSVELISGITPANGPGLPACGRTCCPGRR